MKRIKIDSITVDREILTAKFVCDINKCKGVCCYVPDEELVGPPLTNDEAKAIRSYKTFIADMIPNDGWHDSEKRKRLARAIPLTVENNRPPYRVRLHDCTCLFCTAKGCILKTIRKESPLTGLDEPISCSLFPIVEEDTKKGKVIYLEHLFDDYCKDAYTKGLMENTYLIDFLREPLILRFGSAFYFKLKGAQKDELKHRR